MKYRFLVGGDMFGNELGMISGYQAMIISYGLRPITISDGSRIYHAISDKNLIYKVLVIE